jgi:hypothetical protein
MMMMTTTMMIKKTIGLIVKPLTVNINDNAGYMMLMMSAAMVIMMILIMMLKWRTEIAMNDYNDMEEDDEAGFLRL